MFEGWGNRDYGTGKGVPKDDQSEFEVPKPSFREVAVPVPTYQQVQRNGRIENVYTGDYYYRGYELQAGIITEHTLHTDSRFANDPRVILYATTRTPIEETIYRYDLDTRQHSMLRPDNVTIQRGRFAAGSINLHIGGNVYRSCGIEEPPPKQDTPDFEHVESYTIDRVLVRTSQRLNPLQVGELRLKKAINFTARNFSYPQGRLRQA